MARNKRNFHPAISLFIILILLCNSSCIHGQEHSQNENWLNIEKIAEKSTVVLNNQNHQLPVIELEKNNIVHIDFGVTGNAVFDSLLNKYTNVDYINAGSYLSAGLNGLIDDSKYYQTIIITLTYADKAIVDFILEKEKHSKVIVALYGDGRNLSLLDQLNSPIIWSQPANPPAFSFVAQAIFGGVSINNTLKESYSQKFAAGSGDTLLKIRLRYMVPEGVGINADDLAKIDQIANEAITQHATPGAVVLVAKNGNVIFNKAYGNFTYDNSRPVKINDIYDLASVTKISATTLAVMQLVENNQLNLDSTLSNYIARTRTLNKAGIHLREIMLHQAGFTPYIPFYQNLKPGDYSTDSSAVYTTKVADHYFLRKNYYEEVMWPQMLKSSLATRGKYVYSDLSMYYMKEVVEGVTREHLPQYVSEQFYQPLGLQVTGFNPRLRFAKDRIVPTEEDTYFRKTVVQGYVHDQGAAMAGGVAGHAGLFSNANDLAILFQMLLNGGAYGGKQYFKPETVNLFTSKQSDVSRRGLGFDRWEPDLAKHYPSRLASPETYGHTGYTGTCVWIDPASQLVYIFLSNRVYPKVTDKLSNLNIRPRIQDAIYEAIKNAQPLVPN